MSKPDDAAPPADDTTGQPTVTWQGPAPSVPQRAAEPVVPQFPDHEILGPLGKGGMGVVYRARDCQHDTIVALKTLLRFSAADLYGFKQEFRALADLNHPNLVSLYQLLSTGEHWCFTMELVEGQNFLAAIRQVDNREVPATYSDEMLELKHLTGHEPRLEPQSMASAPLFDERKLRDLLLQLAEGLCFLHVHGKLHCDLKPSNVMVDAKGRVVILDFGLVQESARKAQAQAVSADFNDHPGNSPEFQEHTWTQAGMLRGTILYMSPEQAGCQTLTPATDWYAFGVMLFEALTGQLPFRGGFEVVQRKQDEDPPPPSRFASSLPPDLESLCLDLLQRDPAARPDGEQVLVRLGGAERVASYRSPPGVLPFVGRLAQLERLRAAWQQVCEGRGSLVLLQGPSGAGKSALVQRFLGELAAPPVAAGRSATRSEVMVLRGRCFEQESVPFKAVDALMDYLSHMLVALPFLQVEELIPPGIAALAQMFPVLRRVVNVSNALADNAAALEAQEVRRQAFAALRELLARLARHHPLVLWVDDLQWGDLDSAELLAALLHDPAPALFLLSYRGEYTTTSVCLHTLFHLLEKSPNLLRHEVPVEPLTTEEAVLLARKLLSPQVASEQAERIARESGGNPYFVQELTRHAQSRESVGPQQALSRVELDDVVWARVCRLPESARMFLEILAVAGQPLQQQVAWQAASLHGDDRRQLSLLRNENLVRGSGPRPEDEVETFHDRIRESIRMHLAPATLRAHHERLALKLESVPGTAPERLAMHFAGAGQRARASSLFARAGEAAAAALAFDLAAAHFRNALEQGPADQETARRLRRQLGDALANTGRGTEAAEAYLEAARGANQREALLLRGQAGSQLLFAGRTDEGLVVLQEVLGSVGMKPRATVLGTLLSLRWHQFKLWLRGLKFHPRAEAELPETDRDRLDITWPAALGLSIVDPVRGYDLQARNVLLALRLGEAGRIARVLSMFAAHMSAEGSSTDRYVRKQLDIAEKLADTSGQPYSQAIVLHDRGVSSFDFAEFRQSVDYMDRAQAIYQKSCTGVYWELDTVRTFALWSLGYLGELGELRRRQVSLVKEARARNARYALTNFQTYTTLFAPLAAEDLAAAQEQLDEARRGWTPRGYYIQTHTMHFGQILLDFYLGRAQAVWDLLAQEWWNYRTSALLQIQIIRTFLLHSRGSAALALSAQAASPRSWLRWAARDAARLRNEGTLWAASLGWLLEGGVALRQNRAPAAVLALEQAITGFDRLGTCLYAAGARRRLGVLVGGDRGQELLRQATETLTAQQVHNHDRLIALVTPGFPS